VQAIDADGKDRDGARLAELTERVGAVGMA
jgi:hypothetical protein